LFSTKKASDGALVLTKSSNSRSQLIIFQSNHPIKLASNHPKTDSSFSNSNPGEANIRTKVFHAKPKKTGQVTEKRSCYRFSRHL